MATSTLIQYLETTQVSGLGVTSSIGPATSDRSQVETFLAGGSITSGDWVIFDTSATGPTRVLQVIKSPATAGNPLVLGVALNTVTSGQKVNVVVSGYVASANVVSGVLKGEAIVSSGATAGRALKYATGTHTNAGPCGVALEDASAGNVAAVWVHKQF